MKIEAPGAPHLTYCTNIHPGESWPDVRRNLETHLLAIRARAAGAARFGVGLRLSARAAEALAAPAELEAFRDFLARNGLYVFTINGFPYGPFHGAAVKERVYLPDWRDDARLAYSDRLAALLADLLPDDLDGSVSTVPGAFEPAARAPEDAGAIASRLVRHAAFLVDLRRRTGKHVALALEPEPCCLLETTPETIAFFEEHVFPRRRAAELAALTGLAPAAAEQALRDHLGVCFDACHLAVEFEDAPASLAALAAAGLRVPKIQISAGLRVPSPARDPAIATQLRAWAEGVYLHQVVERRAGAGALVRYLDLPDALAALSSTFGAPGRLTAPSAPNPDARRPADPLEWRIHFHVPIFRPLDGPITSTQPDLRALLASLRERPASQHLEVETYTWDVLPEEHRREGVVEAVARELAWAREHLEGPPAGALPTPEPPRTTP